MENKLATQETAPREKGRTTYKVAGQDVTLSYDIVRNFLTKGDGKVNDQDLVQFISICKYNQLNPFLNEAYLVKFGTQPATMIVSKEALFKRAEENPSYEGIQAGIIVQRNGEYMDIEGCFYGQSDKLVGGWAKVYRSDRKYPIVARVRLEEYDKGKSTWTAIKSTMISKVAKVQALREAFPTQLGAMYTEEEITSKTIDVEHEDVTFVKAEIAEAANKKTITMPKADQEPATKGDKPTNEQAQENGIPPMFE